LRGLGDRGLFYRRLPVCAAADKERAVQAKGKPGQKKDVRVIACEEERFPCCQSTAGPRKPEKKNKEKEKGGKATKGNSTKSG